MPPTFPVPDRATRRDLPVRTRMFRRTRSGQQSARRPRGRRADARSRWCSGALVPLLAVLGALGLALFGAGLRPQASGLVLLLALLLLSLTLVAEVVAATQAAGSFLGLALRFVEGTHAFIPSGSVSTLSDFCGYREV